MRVAEYVLGTLPAAEAAMLERGLEHDRELQLEVAYWEEQLGQLGLQLTPVEPPAGVWDAIRAHTTERAGPTQSASAPERRRPSRLWQGLAVAASIVAVVLAGRLYMVASTPEPVVQPTYVSVFHDQSTATDWLVTVREDTGKMAVVAMGTYPLPEGKELRLWVIPKGGKPIASGVVPADGRNSWPMAARVAKLLEDPATKLAVSMEAAGEPVSDGPQGPILWQTSVNPQTG